MLKMIGKFYGHFWYGIFSVIAGVYILFHNNYLDDPRVTPPPPPSYMEHIAFQFADDWWFGIAMIAFGVILVAGVLLNSKRLRDLGLALVALPYGALLVAFGVRGLLDFRFNLTWVFVGLAVVLLIGIAGRGDYRGH